MTLALKISIGEPTDEQCQLYQELSRILNAAPLSGKDKIPILGLMAGYICAGAILTGSPQAVIAELFTRNYALGSKQAEDAEKTGTLDPAPDHDRRH